MNREQFLSNSFMALGYEGFIKEMARREEELTKQIEKLQVQLAGCSCMALGNDDPPLEESAYGWSVAYEDVRNLRKQLELAIKILDKTEEDVHEQRETINKLHKHKKMSKTIIQDQQEEINKLLKDRKEKDIPQLKINSRSEFRRMKVQCPEYLDKAIRAMGYTKLKYEESEENE